MSDQHVRTFGQGVGQWHPVSGSAPLGLVQGVDDQDDGGSVLCHRLLEKRVQKVGIVPCTVRQMIEGEPVAGNQFCAQVLQASAGRRASFRPEEEHRGVVISGPGSRHGRFAQARVGHQPENTALVGINEGVRLGQKKLPSNEPACQLLDGRSEVVNVILQVGVAGKDGLIHGVVMPSHQDTPPHAPFDVNSGIGKRLFQVAESLAHEVEIGASVCGNPLQRATVEEGAQSFLVAQFFFQVAQEFGQGTGCLRPVFLSNVGKLFCPGAGQFVGVGGIPAGEKTAQLPGHVFPPEKSLVRKALGPLPVFIPETPESFQEGALERQVGGFPPQPRANLAAQAGLFQSVGKDGVRQRPKDGHGNRVGHSLLPR